MNGCSVTGTCGLTPSFNATLALAIKACSAVNGAAVQPTTWTAALCQTWRVSMG